MLDEKEIQAALHAQRVVPLNIKNSHGPFGMEQLAAIVAEITTHDSIQTHQIRRTIALPIETWAKLDNMAEELSDRKSRHISASEVATALVIQSLNGSGETAQ